MIGHGVQSIMIGHIGAPELSRHFRPGLADKDILPATLAPELLQDLLRGELGFNGLILTDASQMIGLTQAMKRKDLVPATIAAGCDMFLFFRNPAEDFQYMLDGYKSGVITEQRLHDALRRILALKASLGLHRKAAQRARPAGRSAGRRSAAKPTGPSRRRSRTRPSPWSRTPPATCPSRRRRTNASGCTASPAARTSPAPTRWPTWTPSRPNWKAPASRCTCSRRRTSGRRQGRPA